MNGFPFFIVFGFAIVGGGLIYTYMRVTEQRQRITEHLAQLGASDVSVQYRLFDFDKSNFTFDVSYRDASGLSHHTICKTHGSWMHDGRLYWDSAPQITPQLVQGQPTQDSLTDISTVTKTLALQDVYAQSSSAKDQFISKLIVENARLRTRQHESNLAELH